MGEVYAARDPNLGRKIAIKVLSSELALRPAALQRFGQEARSASALNHPNIITIYEVGLESSTPYIAMEYVDGRDLRSIIADGKLSTRRILNIACQIADGLAAAHERGIVHRDLKPENVMLTRDGFVKILDFGLAKLVPTSGEDEATHTFLLESPGTRPGTILGTVGYMSPEQASGLAIDFRSDQFSFGAIAYELATSRRAFDGKTAVDTLSAILHQQPEPLAKLNPHLPAPLRWIIERCLAKEPDERYQSTRDLARELRNVLERLSEASDDTTAVDVVVSPRRGWRVAAAASLLAAIASGAGWMIWKDRQYVSANAAMATVPSTRVVAIFPFEDDRDSTFATGFAATVGSRLGMAEGLQIVPPASTVELSDAAPSAVASKLGAHYLLRGQIMRAANRMRVGYSLIDCRTGRQVAGATLTGSPAEAFSIQDAIAADVAKRLSASIASERAGAERLDGLAQDLYLQAVGYLQRYENEASVDGAIALLERLRTQTSNSEVAAALARGYLYKFRLTRDEVWSRRAAETAQTLASGTTNAETLTTIGEIEFERGEHEKAKAALQRALALRPMHAEATLVLAETHKALGENPAAEAAYRRAIELRPEFWGNHNKLGAFYITTGQAKKAIDAFLKVTTLTPDNPRGYNNLGAAYQQSGDYEKAIAAFERSVTLRPSGSAYANLGTCLFFEQRFAEAARSFERAAALAPNVTQIWANLGDAYRWIEGEEERADAAYDQAITLARKELHLDPRDGATRATLAVCLAKRGSLDAAKTEIARALRDTPADVTLKYQAATVAHLSGDRAAATRHLHDALRSGYPASEFANDPEFGPLRKLPEFAKILERS